MASDRFPVLDPLRGISLRLRERLIAEGRLDVYPADLPASVPWSVVAPHEAQAKRNHDQTLERLAERGGLSPEEMWGVCNDRPLRDVRDVSKGDAIAWLRSVT